MIVRAKEKAEELKNQFRNVFSWIEKEYKVDLYRESNMCAIILANEVVNYTQDNSQKEYWIKVIEEISKL